MRQDQALLAIDEANELVSPGVQELKERRSVPRRVLADRDMESGGVGASFGELLQRVQASHHRQLEAKASGLGQRVGERRQREIVARGRAQAWSGRALRSQGDVSHVERDVRHHARESLVRRRLRPQQHFTELQQARATSALEPYKRTAKLSLVIAKEAPACTIGNLAGDDCRGKRGGGCDGFEQRNEARIERLAAFAVERPTYCGNNAHYVGIDLFRRGFVWDTIGNPLYLQWAILHNYTYS